jgi:hypothetical protein
MARTGSVVKNLNQSNLHIGSGWISSTSTFTPERAMSSEIFYQSYVATIEGFPFSYITYDSLGDGSTGIKYFKTNTITKLYENSKDFLRKEITIPAGAESKLKFNMKFTVAANNNYKLEKQTGGVANKYEVVSSNGFIYFRVKADNTVVYNRTTSYTGPVEVTIPPGTTSIVLETYDSNFSTTPIPPECKMNPTNSIVLNNIRVHIEGQESVGIGNATNAQTTATHIDPIRSASISVSNVSNNGYYDIIEGPFKDGAAVDYFVVGDTFTQPNYLPRNANRNVCLEFDNVDYSLIDIDKKIELLIDVIDIDTSDAEEVYDDFAVDPVEVKEFYQYGERAKVKATLSLAAFPNTTVAAVSAGNTSPIATIAPTKFKGGLNVYDITQAVIQSIQNDRQKIVIWLSYDKQYARDKYVSFKIGNTATNRPRIRYTLK